MHIVAKYSEQELAAGCQEGEAKYQQALYQSYSHRMYGVCLRYSDNSDDAKDILQEAFVRVFQKISSFRGEGSLEGWIRRIMVHTSIEHYRRNSRYFMVDVEQAKGIQLDANVLSDMSRDEILLLINALPPGYRTVFNLYIIEGYTHDEIGGMLNISSGTSKSQLSRAKAMLKKQIEEQQSRHTG